MKVLINNNEYECQDVNCKSKKQKNGTFLLVGIDTKLVNLASNGIKEKMRFDVVINNNGKIILDGEYSFFSNLKIISNEVLLNVNWINGSAL